MISKSLNVASLSLAVLLTLAAGFGQQSALATGDALGLSSMFGGIGGAVDNIVNPVAGTGSILGGTLGAIPNVFNAATGMVGGITGPVMGALGSMSGGILGQSGLGNLIGGTLGGGEGVVNNAMRLTSGALGGVTSGLTNGLTGLSQADESVGESMAAAAAASQARANVLISPQLRNNFKREAIAEGAMRATANTAAAANSLATSRFGASGLAAVNGLAAAGSMAANSLAAGGLAAGNMAANTFAAGSLAAGNLAANGLAAAAGNMAANEYSMANSMANSMVGSSMASAAASSSAAATQGAVEAGMMAGAATAGAALGGIANAAHLGAAMATSAAANQEAAVESVAANTAGLMAANAIVGGRQVLASEAIKNAQAESAAAGAEMVAHGAVNARSASLASNAYRQAKLASARDRVDIAGTIQNSARISDAAIATHDAATKAEDSLLGSELSVDSASTVLDSDAAYIPPVTNSLLRSLPYGRLGLRNIIPKPLTHPSVMLPDVWLNGVPVNYLNVPLRMLPYGIGAAASVNSLAASNAALASGAIINRQPFFANNGLVLNGMVFDPAYAYLAAANLNGVVSSSLAPILANGQLEAQDELAVANSLNIQQLNGVGMASTYQGYGRLNPVPMITGSVSDVALMPTTTIGTTYPIGSALVIEPRDSYFQDYTDNASSRQNFDERQQ